MHAKKHTQTELTVLYLTPEEHYRLDKTLDMTINHLQHLPKHWRPYKFNGTLLSVLDALRGSDRITTNGIS